MQLSKNFTLQELIRSNTAVTLGLDNSPPKHVIDNLKILCERILQPLRDFFGVPIVISSGYRCAALNKAVGGVSTSQHMTGEAADIQLPKTYGTLDGGWKLTDMEIARRWFSWLRDNTDFDHYQNLNLIKSRVCDEYPTDCVSRVVLIIMYDNNICSHE